MKYLLWQISCGSRCVLLRRELVQRRLLQRRLLLSQLLRQLLQRVFLQRRLLRRKPAGTRSCKYDWKSFREFARLL
jgi:hypothetical protein